MDFLQLGGKRILVMGVANKKSIAFKVAKLLKEAGAEIFISVQREEMVAGLKRYFPEGHFLVCDVARAEERCRLAQELEKVVGAGGLDGFLHSLAFAAFEDPPKAYHEVAPEDFLKAYEVSALSLTSTVKELKDLFSEEASVVTVSISDLQATVYGMLGPIKAALQYSVPYLAKSFSAHSGVRFNSVGAGPLKTAASAGIPGYLDNYFFSEALTMRKKALTTEEVANAILFLLSPRSSGINGSNVVVDAGMSSNTFDQKIVQTYMKENF